jgi:Ser/Thr protein kinase RdoA (MazF antagonist)
VTYALGLFYLPRPGRVAQYLQAKLGSPRIGTHTAQEVLARYGLKLVRPPRNLPFGWRSRNVIVETSSGNKVLKLYRSGSRLPAIRHEHSIISHLNSVHFPVPRLLLTQANETVVRHDGEFYGLFDYLEGTNLASSILLRSHQRSLMAAAGKILAQYHHELEGFQPSGEHHLGYQSLTQARLRDWAWHETQLRRLPDRSKQIADPRDQANARWLTQNADRISDRLAHLGEYIENVQLPRLAIHGDFGIHNLSYRQDGTLTMHDFELARIEWRLIDIVVVLSRLRLERSHEFMAAYQAEYPLTAKEWHFLPEVWQLYKLSGAVSYWNTYVEYGGSYRLAAARERIGDADWALANRTTLLNFKERFEA